jgi:signal transduction histidine kinase
MEPIANSMNSHMGNYYSFANRRKAMEFVGDNYQMLPSQPLPIIPIFDMKQSSKMRMNLKKLSFNNLWSKLLGDRDEFTMQNRAFNAISILTLAILAILIPLNIYLSLPIISVIASVLLLAQGYFYYLSRIQKKFLLSVIMFAILSYAAIVASYYFNSGIKGTAIYFFFLTLFMLMTITRRSIHWLWVTLHITIGTALFACEYYYPDWIKNTYQSQGDYFLDTITTFIITLLFIFFIVNFLLSNYRREKLLAKERARAIHAQNQQITAQNLKLEKLNQEKDKLFSIVSHDFRSPLTSIQGYLEIFAEFSMDKGEEDMKRELLNLTKNTSDMLMNLLSWSKNQMQGVEVQQKAINISEAINQTLAIQKSLAHNKEIDINCSVDTSTKVLADPDMFQLIIRNVVNNAIKFSPRGEKINIIVSKVDGECQVCVKDNGVGIPMDKQKDIFSLKSKSTYGTGNEKGMSLGLTLCKEFVELQKGKIWFKSDAGKGSEFYFSLPLAA